ncbi:MAG: SurA N-terminal domain-containing protein, partial [Gammaproteobacteria bacterium]
MKPTFDETRRDPGRRRSQPDVRGGVRSLGPAAAGLAALLIAAPACAQQSQMQFPSFNSVITKPQGDASAGGEPARRAARKPAAARHKKAKPAGSEVASQTDAAREDRSSDASELSIAVLVDDEPITGYEIGQRQRLLGLSANVGDKASAAFKRIIQDPATSEHLKAILGEVIKANPGKSREQIIAIFEERKKQFAVSLQKRAIDSARASVLPTLRKQALDELIEERLKLLEAKRLNVLASDEDVNRIVHNLAEKNKMTDAQFAQHIKSLGSDIETMRARFRASLSWNDVIRKQYGYQISISGREIDQVVS